LVDRLSNRNVISKCMPDAKVIFYNDSSLSNHSGIGIISVAVSRCIVTLIIASKGYRSGIKLQLLVRYDNRTDCLCGCAVIGL
jgi:hypothetical protein